jgi:dTDP-4-dehydrorhamnose reductase
LYGKKTNWIKYDPTGKTPDAADTLPEVLTNMPNNPDIIINCCGVIKPFYHINTIDSIYINSIFPRELATYCKALGIQLIHITTDCCFSGARGSYIESDLHDALDEYGKSKSLGEPPNAMVIRTSIIGPEIHKNASLIAWAQSQAGKTVNGFKNHKWNGMTTQQYARVCDEIITKDLYEEGIFHVHSDTITKFQLLKLIDGKYNLGLDIKEVDATEAVDRSLATEKKLVSKLTIPSLQEQIMSL